MHSGKAAGPVSWFVQRVGTVFLFETSNMLNLLGWVLGCLYFIREELCSVGARNTVSFMRITKNVST